MSFEFNDAPISIRAEIQEALRKEWAFLAAPGTWWSGAERVAIAAEARRAMLESLSEQRLRDQAVAGERTASRPTSILGEHVTAVVRAVAADSPLITAEWVAGLADDGVSLPAYAEIIGIVARLSAVDLFHRALGMPLEPLPEPRPGDPSRTPPPTDLVVGKSFVPMSSHGEHPANGVAGTPGDGCLAGAVRRVVHDVRRDGRSRLPSGPASHPDRAGCRTHLSGQ